jgi:phosphate uptake regulator
MKRKLVKQGRNALTVTVPAEWTKKFGLNAGNDVEVEIIDENIQISSGKAKETGKKMIDVSGLDPMIKRILGAIYKAGYDEAEVRFETAKEFETIQDVIRDEFIGFEIVQHGKNNLVFKEISTLEPKEFNTMMRRMFLIIKSMADDCLEAIKKNDTDFLKVVFLRDKDVNKIADFCRRSLNNGGHLIEGRTAPLYFIAEQLEKVGDIYRDICKLMIKEKISPNSDIINFFEETNDFFERFYNLYFDFDLKKMALFGRRRYELIEKSEKIIESSSKKEFPLIFYLKQAIESTFDMNGPLMAARL